MCQLDCLILCHDFYVFGGDVSVTWCIFCSFDWPGPVIQFNFQRNVTIDTRRENRHKYK